MSIWNVRALGDMCDEGGGIIKTGPFGSQLHQSDYTDTGIPVVMPKDITEDRVNDSEIARKSEEDAMRLSQHRLSAGNIVYGRRGDIGRHALITKREDGWLCGTGCLRIHLGNKSLLNPVYLYYYLKQRQIIEWIINQAIGATMPNLNTSILRFVVIRYPGTEVQEKIAAILSAYDDLIENNLRRIKILEGMAQTIYREWFVKFRFPGHQEVKMVDSPLGKIPEGWEIKQIGEVVETLGGGTPSTKEPSYWEGGNIDWYSPSDLTASQSMFITGSSKKITQIGLERSSAKLFPAYSLMMTSRATIGVLSINAQKACTNQGFITCVPNDRLSVFHLYFWIEENREKIISVASGATFKEISRGEFREFSIAVPPPPIENIFAEAVEPMCKIIENLIKKNQILRQTRDLLLPKLISGELNISELDVNSANERS